MGPEADPTNISLDHTEQQVKTNWLQFSKFYPYSPQFGHLRNLATCHPRTSQLAPSYKSYRLRKVQANVSKRSHTLFYSIRYGLLDTTYSSKYSVTQNVSHRYSKVLSTFCYIHKLTDVYVDYVQ